VPTIAVAPTSHVRQIAVASLQRQVGEEKAKAKEKRKRKENERERKTKEKKKQKRSKSEVKAKTLGKSSITKLLPESA
jgi:hypothetical protein